LPLARDGANVAVAVLASLACGLRHGVTLAANANIWVGAVLGIASRCGLVSVPSDASPGGIRGGGCLRLRGVRTIRAAKSTLSNGELSAARNQCEASSEQIAYATRGENAQKSVNRHEVAHQRTNCGEAVAWEPRRGFSGRSPLRLNRQSEPGS
jgi:hypothetical protein